MEYHNIIQIFPQNILGAYSICVRGARRRSQKEVQRDAEALALTPLNDLCRQLISCFEEPTNLMYAFT